MATGETRGVLWVLRRLPRPPRLPLLAMAVMAGAAACAADPAGGGGGGDEDAGDDDPGLPMNLIDDLEDGDDVIGAVNGRAGVWYTFHDATAGGVQTPGDEFTPTAGGAGGSAWCARSTGHGFTDWGAGIGFDLNHPDAPARGADAGPGTDAGPAVESPKGTYDGSAFTGIAFKAKGNVPIRFAVEIEGVVPTDRGGSCTASTVAGQECDDVHGKLVNLGADWKEYKVPFAELRQGGWGKPAAFDAATLTAIQFHVEMSLTFDFAVDDVRLY